jgi:hypothetical protein
VAIALILVSVGLVVCLYLLLMGKKDAPVAVRSSDAANAASSARSEDRSGKSAENELDKKRKELEELKKQFGELKEELKAAKKKAFDQKEAGKAGEDLVKARAEVERQASIQLENTRAELATALAELQKMKGDEGKPGRRSVPVAAAVTAPVAAAPVVAAPPVQKVIRELSEGDREKIQRAEAESAKNRLRIAELEKAMKNSKGRGDAATHQLKIARTEGQLAKDKFRALEHRVNRLMLERDLMVRAIKDLEKKSGIAAERVELTPDEIAASDQKVSQKQAAEDKAAAESLERLEAAAVAAPVAEAAAPAAEAVPTPPPAQA